MGELINLDKLPEVVRQLVEPYAQELVSLLGESIHSIVIFGSAVGKDYIPKKSNVNLLVVCERVELADLKKCFKLVSRGRKKGIVAPLFLTKRHMETSSDVFPIEFLDMKDFHQVIYGEEVLEGLVVGSENLRLECEEQLKGKLIRLRQAYLEVGSNVRALTRVLVESLTSLVPVFRGMLRLLKKEAPASKSEVIDAVCDEFGVAGEVFVMLLDVKAGKTSFGKEEIEKFFGKYMGEIERLAVAVDRRGSASKPHGNTRKNKETRTYTGEEATDYTD